MAKSQYYDVEKTLKNYPDAKYYIIFGERSNGKSYSILKHCVKEFYESDFKYAFGYLRRWTEDIRTMNMQQVFKSLISNDKGKNAIEEVTNKEFNSVKYDRKHFYLIHINDKGEIDNQIDNPMGYVFGLSESERIKSTGYPDIMNIFFEEFIAEGLPMVNEFTRFTSILSTIIRNRDNATIFMAGNTINKYNVYFAEMGLNHAKYQAINTVDIYKYQDGKKELKIACEYCDFPDKSVKKSNIYFAFNKEKNKMIINGAWQIESYPHLTHYYTPADVKLIYFIEYQEQIFQCEVIRVKDNKDTRIFNENEKELYSNKNVTFTYIHRKTTDIRDPYEHIIYGQTYSSHPNIRRSISNAYDDIGKFIWSFFITDKVEYQDNEVGDAIDSYLRDYK